MQVNVLEYLNNSVAKYPKKISFADDERSINYADFAKSAKLVAHSIINTTQFINNPIMVLVDRNVDSLVGLFGVLYSGNYYVPVDNKMPKARILSIFSQVNPLCILYTGNDELLAKEIAENTNINILNVSKIIDNINSLEIDDIFENCLKGRTNKILDVDPTYIIFTSGSTGIPKGIVISHRSVIDFTDWMTNTFGFTENDIMANQAPFYFDLSVKDIYTTIKNGATTYILSRKTLMFPPLLVDFINEKAVTSLIWATSAFNLVANSKIFDKKVLKNVNKVILGGEALLAKHLNTWKKANPNIQYVNLYGPTEVTVDCTYYKIDKDFKDDEAVPIGKACENKEVFILNNENKLAPIGEIGEICVRGTGLAKGYFGNFEKTNEVFIQNPLNDKYPDIIYKTGDLGYLNEEKNIVFCSRKDGQIKHQGYRIELGEIERAINSNDKINSAFCFYDSIKDKIVCIFEGICSDDELIKFVSNLIPKYMFPNRIIRLDKMPYNANGKIDRVSVKEDYFNGKYN